MAIKEKKIEGQEQGQEKKRMDKFIFENRNFGGA